MSSFSLLIMASFVLSCATVVANTNLRESEITSEFTALSSHDIASSTFASNFVMLALQPHLLTRRRCVSSIRFVTAPMTGIVVPVGKGILVTASMTGIVVPVGKGILVTASNDNANASWNEEVLRYTCSLQLLITHYTHVSIIIIQKPTITTITVT